MKRRPTPAIDLVTSAVRLVLACRAGRACPTHLALARLLGCSVPTLRVALARLHAAGALKVEQISLIGGTRTRMRDFRWSGWTTWSARVPYGPTTQALMRTWPAGVEAVA